MKYINSTIALLLLITCNGKKEDPSAEGYQRLLSFKGIERPMINYEDLVHKQRDTEHYVYPTAEVPQEARQYTVTLTYQCKKDEGNSRDLRYYVCYVNANRERMVLSATTAKQTLAFILVSGYPLYLGVYGGGERESRVSAQLTAVDNQGVVGVPALQYIVAQNTDGTDNIAPYHEYIVLP